MRLAKKSTEVTWLLSPLQMRILRVNTDPNHPTALPMKFSQSIGVGSQLRRTNESEIQRVKEEESVAGLGRVRRAF